jgi:hypothetical protein
MPNGYLIYPANTKQKGLADTIEIPIPNNSSDIPGKCSSCNTSTNTNTSVFSGSYKVPYAFSPAQNALKRVRSSGMIPRQFDISNKRPTYYTDTKQYLTSRNRTQAQNQFNYLSKGNSQSTPGTAAALSNAYYANGLPICGKPTPVYYKPNNSQFAQQGGVCSSSHITRVKYDSITNSSLIYKKALGQSVANAMAYGVSDQGYTVKDIVGFPNICTPIFNKSTGQLSKCNTFIYRR